MTPVTKDYCLIYWPFLQGRGEFVRLVLEEAALPYVDLARLPEDEGGGVNAVLRYLGRDEGGPLGFAPPLLQVGDLLLAQTSNICQFLARRHRLVPDDLGAEATANQLQLTVSDLVAEVHDTHHPVSTELFYEDQKPEAKKRSALFLSKRLPKFFRYFQSTIRHHGGPYLLGAVFSYPDLALFQAVAGLSYAFPRAIESLRSGHAELFDLAKRVADRAPVAAYLESPRRLPFSEDGIFRHYPELDLDA